MHRNYQISKETEDKVKLAKQYVECNSTIIKPNTNLFYLKNNSKDLAGNASLRLSHRLLSQKRKKKQ